MTCFTHFPMGANMVDPAVAVVAAAAFTVAVPSRLAASIADPLADGRAR
ncbi:MULTISPECIES: hypothetical protein [unclassified Frankia]|nr:MULTISPECIES: hypothetical protein [unclassified Frankia]